MRISVKTFAGWAWLLGGIGGCGGRVSGDGYVTGALNTSFAGTRSSLGGSSLGATAQPLGGNRSTGGISADFGGTSPATGGATAGFGEATLVGIGGAQCAVVYNGQTYVSIVSQELCGNGLLEYGNGEYCDDANQNSGDGCSSGCRLESNWPCSQGCGPCTRTVVCGDGVVDPGEMCDDGNTDSDDGCTENCQIGPSGPCIGLACTFPRDCGDGVIQGDEACDEGANNVDGGCGACSTTCTLGPYCGDGVMQADCGELCDDGSNTGSYGGCAANCTFGPYCGDGLVQSSFGEQCDVGSLNGTSDAWCGAQCNILLLP
jgi:cysteine-rich repeat protein